MKEKNATKTALVTGASRGLGATLADWLSARGYALILTARGAADLAATAERLAGRGASVEAIAGDVSDAEHRRRLAATAAAHGGLDLLINNASGLGVSPLPALVDYPLDRLEQLFTSNTLAPLGLIQATRTLLAARRGIVINLSSDAARGGYPGWGGYGASKAALDLLSLTLAQELAADGIAVVSVDPGDLRTRMHQDAFPGEDISDRPLPEITLPFWAWLLGQPSSAVNGHRYEAQAERWEVTP